MNQMNTATTNNMEEQQLPQLPQLHRCVVHQLPVHPRQWHMVAATCSELRDAVDGGREVLRCEMCSEHRLPGGDQSTAKEQEAVAKRKQLAEYRRWQKMKKSALELASGMQLAKDMNEQETYDGSPNPNRFPDLEWLGEQAEEIMNEYDISRPIVHELVNDVYTQQWRDCTLNSGEADEIGQLFIELEMLAEVREICRARSHRAENEAIEKVATKEREVGRVNTEGAAETSVVQLAAPTVEEHVAKASDRCGLPVQRMSKELWKRARETSCEADHVLQDFIRDWHKWESERRDLAVAA